MAYQPEELNSRIEDLRDKEKSDELLREKYLLKDVSYWKLSDARKELDTISQHAVASFVKDYCYRPFDFRYVYYHPAVCERLRTEVMAHMTQGNLALLTHRPQSPGDFTFAYCTTMIGDQCVAANKSAGGGNSFQFPLYLYPREKQDLLDDAPQEKRANFSAEFLDAVARKLGFVIPASEPESSNQMTGCRIKSGMTDGDEISPESLFAYLYAVLYAPGYRARYAEFLKRDFPRIPLTADRALFKRLVELGQQLVELHLMQSAPSPQPLSRQREREERSEGRGRVEVRYPIAGSNRMDKVDYRFSPSPQPSPIKGEGVSGRVYINAEQYFDGVPQAVWDYHIGGYQVAAKWLKDRKGRLLSFDDLQHYQRVIAALAETIRLQAEIDAAIPAWPLQ